MAAVFFQQQIERIRRDGYVTFANPEFAREVMAALPRPEFAKVNYVGGVGRMAVDGYIFLPRAKREITAKIKRELKQIEGYADRYRSALAYLSNVKGVPTSGADTGETQQFKNHD